MGSMTVIRLGNSSHASECDGQHVLVLAGAGTLIFTILPTIWLYKWNKRRKLGPNACPACGYDLTGNETGVCPECGASKMVA